jgi:hypothetical protein
MHVQESMCNVFAPTFTFNNIIYFTPRSSKWYIKRNTSRKHPMFPTVNIRLKLQLGREVKVYWTQGLSILFKDHHADSTTRLVPPGPRSPTVHSVMPRLGPRNQSSPNKKSNTTNDGAIVFPNTCCEVSKKKYSLPQSQVSHLIDTIRTVSYESLWRFVCTSASLLQLDSLDTVQSRHTNKDQKCKIWGFHSGDYDDYHLLGDDTVWLL